MNQQPHEPEPPGYDYDRPGGALRWVLAELARRGHRPVPFGPAVVVKVKQQGELGLEGRRDR